MLFPVYVSAPIPMGIHQNPDLVTPYTIALSVVILAFVALLIFLPSMRKYRRKRNIIVYAVALLIIALLIFQINESFNSTRALVSYSFDADLKYYYGTANQFAIICSNFGDKSASFYINCSVVNASLQANHQDYIQVDSSTVKIPFFLEEGGLPLSEDKKYVSFSIDENATGFEFSLWPDELSSSVIVASGTYDIYYTWNTTENCFVHSGGGSFTA